MEVCLLSFEYSGIGGIARWEKDLKWGFEQIGVEVDHIEDINKESYDSLPDHDYYILNQPCPWKDRKLSDEEQDRWWLNIYDEIKDSVVVAAFHDPYWERYYDWANEALPMDVAIAVQDIVRESLTSFTAAPVGMIRHPLRHDRGELIHDKEDIIMSACMFKGWKNVDHFIHEVPFMDLESHVHGKGIEYHYMSGSMEKRKSQYRDEETYEWIWDRAEDSGKMTYKGFTELEELWETYRSARFAVDFSHSKNWEGVINYTQLEPMIYGAIPIVYQDTVNKFIEDQVFTVHSHEDLPELVNNIENEKLDGMREDNYNWVIENFGADNIAQEYVDLFKEVEEGTYEGFKRQSTFDSF